MKPQVTPDHYINPSYDSKERFISYWHQLTEILSLNPQGVLEIGIGNKFISNYLKTRGLKIKTLDIDKRLGPDVVGSILEIPFIDNYFDVVICSEVLEHLPYATFSDALKEIWRVSRKNVILSLPDFTTVYRINIELPRLKPIRMLVSHPFHRSVPHVFDGQHYWEIGRTGYSCKKIRRDIENEKFKIVRTYRIFEYYYRFFLLKKNE